MHALPEMVTIGTVTKLISNQQRVKAHDALARTDRAATSGHALAVYGPESAKTNTKSR